MNMSMFLFKECGCFSGANPTTDLDSRISEQSRGSGTKIQKKGAKNLGQFHLPDRVNPGLSGTNSRPDLG